METDNWAANPGRETNTLASGYASKKGLLSDTTPVILPFHGPISMKDSATATNGTVTFDEYLARAIKYDDLKKIERGFYTTDNAGKSVFHADKDYFVPDYQSGWNAEESQRYKIWRDKISQFSSSSDGPDEAASRIEGAVSQALVLAQA